jgi:Ca2+-binding EF-hand superfamily protein
MKHVSGMIFAIGVCVAMPVMAQAPANAMDKANMMVDASMKMMDTNGDGMVSMDERAAASSAMFKAADTNADGMLSAEEMLASSVKEKTDMGMTADPDKTKMMVTKKIAMMDADKDGMVSMAEAEASSKAMFTAGDTNADGMLSRQEMADGMMKHMKSMN